MGFTGFYRAAQDHWGACFGPRPCAPGFGLRAPTSALARTISARSEDYRFWPILPLHRSAAMRRLCGENPTFRRRTPRPPASPMSLGGWPTPPRRSWTDRFADVGLRRDVLRRPGGGLRPHAPRRLPWRANGIPVLSAAWRKPVDGSADERGLSPPAPAARVPTHLSAGRDWPQRSRRPSRRNARSSSFSTCSASMRSRRSKRFERLI
jgi:hypothetical protein